MTNEELKKALAELFSNAPPAEEPSSEELMMCECGCSEPMELNEAKDMYSCSKCGATKEAK